jgi:hypothetical protein
MLRSLAIVGLLIVATSQTAAAQLASTLTVDFGLIDDGRTRYEYTLTNDATSEFPLDLFLLDTGARLDLEIDAPEGWLIDYAPDEGTFEMLFQADEDSALQPGETAVFTLLTPAAPQSLSYFLANNAHSDEEGGYLLDSIMSPSLRYALRPGDTNADGIVDLVDLNNVRNNFAKTGDPVFGDTEPLDGIVDLYDINQVRNNFGRDYNAAVVPEPASLTLGLIGLMVLASGRIKRRRAT